MRKGWGALVGWMVVFLCVWTTGAAELLRNGSFEDGVRYWRPTPDVEAYDPQVNGHVTLESPDWNFQGDLLWQNVNVDGVGGQTLTVSARLRNSYVTTYSNPVVHVVYVDTGDRVQRLPALRSASPTNNAWFGATNTLTLPPDARKLVRVALYSCGYEADDISVSAPGLAPGAVPCIDTMNVDSAPADWAPYGALLSLEGTDLGATAGTLSVGGSSDGYAILSWSDTAVTARVEAPAVGGAVEVTQDFTGDCGDHRLEIVSPHLTMVQTGWQAHRYVLAGESFAYEYGVLFRNEFSVPGGVAFVVSGAPPGSWSCSPSNVTCSGGTVLTVDTSGLAAGDYAWTLEARGGAWTSSVPVTFTVADVDRVEFLGNGETHAGGASASFSTQAEVSFFHFTLYDANSNQLSRHAVTPVSTNPTAFAVHYSGKENEGSWKAFAVGDGASRLELRGPGGGLLGHLDVSVDVPETPRVTAMSMAPAVVDNAGNTTCRWECVFDAGGNSVGTTTESGDHRQRIDHDLNTAGAWTDFTITEGYTPGSYLWRAQTKIGYSGPTTSERVLPIRIVNAPTHGRVDGHFVFVAGEEFFPDYDLEFYDPATTNGGPLFTRHVRTYEYIAAYVPTGMYKARLYSEWMGIDEWYPTGSSFEQAAVLHVDAGERVDGVNFFFGTAPPDPALERPAGLSASDGTHADRVALSWSPVSGGTHYDVWRNGVDALDSGLKHLARTAATSFDDMAVTGGQTYYYWIKAVASNGVSRFSAATTGYASGGAPMADLFVAKSGTPVEAVLGRDSVTYVLVVSNAGPADAENVVVVDSLSSNTLYVGATGGLVYDAATHTATAALGGMGAGTAASFTLWALPVRAGTATNTVTASSATADGNAGNNTARWTTVCAVAADTNGNQIADWWESEMFGSTTNAYAGDNDRDGLSNGEEYILDYDPTVSNPPFGALEIGPTNSMMLVFPSSHRRAYVVDFRTNLLSGDWDRLGVFAGQAGQTIVVDSAADAFRAYRIKVTLPGAD